jgi:prolyl 4-hydroxylase
MSAEIEALARATRRGEVEAMTQLGKRLVVGDRAPFLPREGARFLIDATHRGGAEAAARLAVLAAAGAFVTQSWDDALDILTVAAERGFLLAQGQLIALVGATGGPVTPETWRRLREKIDLSFWNRPTPATALHDDPNVRAFAGLAPPSVCDWLIDRARDRLVRAEVYDPVAQRDFVSETRTNTAAKFNLVETDVVQLLMQQRMSACCGIPVHHMEGATVLHYAPSEQMTDHYDFVDPRTPGYELEIARNGQRVVTFIVYLNGDYDGGETDFPRLGVRYKGRRGDGLSFTNALPDGQPDLRALHAGLPPTRGEKWLLSQFIRSRPTRPANEVRP